MSLLGDWFRLLTIPSHPFSRCSLQQILVMRLADSDGKSPQTELPKTCSLIRLATSKEQRKPPIYLWFTSLWKVASFLSSGRSGLSHLGSPSRQVVYFTTELSWVNFLNIPTAMFPRLCLWRCLQQHLRLCEDPVSAVEFTVLWVWWPGGKKAFCLPPPHRVLASALSAGRGSRRAIPRMFPKEVRLLIYTST